MRQFLAIFILSMCTPVFAQVTPTASGNVLTYEVFDARKGLTQIEVSFQQFAPGRTLKLNVEENGDRNYAFLDGKPYAVYDKLFKRTANRGRPVSPGQYLQLLPETQKIEEGVKWEFSRSGYHQLCQDWKIAYNAEIKKGPDTVVAVDGKNISLKTLLIEQTGTGAHGDARCSIMGFERSVLYSPELHEILMDQLIDREYKAVSGGYKWAVKSITTSAAPAPSK